MFTLTEEDEYIVIARRLMKEIQYCNGMVNRWEAEKYPEHHVQTIAAAARPFFEAHPEFMNDEDIQQICDGEYSENQARYGIYPEYKALDKSLNNFFDGE